MTRIEIYDDDFKVLEQAADLLGDPIHDVIAHLVEEHLAELIEDLRLVHYNGLK